ncbi:pseudouridine synthase [Fimicolochytrium jonesii]|uniref:pseudouridine synthase n=1 Tax=Fimicolochytrium jonesii TaxID=1396493 RepID=UPI0022FE64FC|nr:pseudouridine synthase [Fimicolochytrium jonesii]KAI8819128.1 pseudouridine synthase [Fimicolochytrium jonesii]
MLSLLWHITHYPTFGVVGLRKVEPYPFVYETFVKGRWQKRPLIETFAIEFQDKPREYYAEAIKRGDILINNQPVTTDYIPRNNDILTHAIHRHEPPVTAQKVELLRVDEDLLVVNKPSSLPIHPTGRYHHNTVLHILRSPEFGLEELYPVNRLDRLTSGLCLIARTKTAAQNLMAVFQDRTVEKTYLCRVRGVFPEEEITCSEPILTISPKLGINAVSPDGKECTTVFKRLSTNGLTSVVECKPLTGRTHQIRVHLQFLGHPIANDPLYCCDVWGKEMGKGGVAAGDIDSIVRQLGPHAFPDLAPVSASEPEDTAPQPQPPQQQEQQVTRTFPPAPGCTECLLTRRDPTPEQLSIWLHSWRYEWDGNMYETPIPEWAQEGFSGDKVLEVRFWKWGGKWDGRAAGAVEEGEG